jgi:agmatinase
MPDFYPNNFGALPEEESSLEAARFVVLSLPYEVTTSYGKGTKFGPGAIIEASRNMELYDEELAFEPCRAGIHTAGDLLFHDTAPEAMVETVEEAVRHYLDLGKTVVCLGGEHNLTYPIVKAHMHRRPAMGVVQIDAHADLRDSYEGSEHNHACAMRRVASLTRKLAQVGIRSLSREESEFLKAEGSWKVVWARDAAGSDDWVDEVIASMPPEVYLTVDIDGFDPSLVPSTGTPEPGGLTWYPTLAFLKRLCAERRVVGFDLMELSPDRSRPAPDFLAARLVYKLMGYIQAGERG